MSRTQEERLKSAANGKHPISRHNIVALLNRYDQPGPRYTSYPTAVEFQDNFPVSEYETRLQAANHQTETPLSIYIHLPFCESRCLFCGCHVIISPHKNRTRPYLDLLRREFAMVAARLPKRRTFAQLHLGGGTPTYFSPKELTTLIQDLTVFFQPVSNAELAVEVDPRVTTIDHIDALADVGFNRLSMGVQDLTPEVQEAVNRVQPQAQAAYLAAAARRRGFKGINMDLIYGLPKQTPETFERTVDAVIDMGADRAAVYSFAYVPWLHGQQKQLSEAAFPDRHTKFLLFAVARERFLNAGYEPIGMDHFARPEDELSLAKKEGRLRRNFQGYTVISSEDVIGFGISAIGDLQKTFVQNSKKLSHYRKFLEADQLPVARGYLCSTDDRIRREVIQQLMCNFQVYFAAIEQQFDICFRDYFAVDLARLKSYADEGLVEMTEHYIKALPLGELFIRNLAMCFDRYWREKHEKEARQLFSRTV
jgi:oxygen-independent coproporphyrinogen-3 oxidase